MVKKATDGRIVVKLEYGVGHPKSLFDAVEDGIVDGAWSFHGYQPGRFEAYRFAEMPIYKNIDGGQVSGVLWDTIEKYYNKNGEFPGYEGLYLAGMWVHPPVQIHLKEPIKEYADIKGRKISMGGGTAKAVGDALGVSGVGLPAPKVYEALQQGVVEGSFFPWDVHEALRLKEVAPYVVEMNSYVAAFGFVLSQDTLESLSEKDREAIKSVSGKKFSRMAGDEWQAYVTKVRNNANTNNIIKTPKLEAEFKELTKNVAKDWLNSRKSKDPNAKKSV